jgi:ferritin-like protein
MQCMGKAVLTRGGLLRRGAVGGGALLASASGLAAVAPSAFADAAPAGDLAYLRLLIAAELLAVDFYTQALERGDLRRAYEPRAQRIVADESEHYALLAALMTAAGQTPATADDIDFSYPGGVLTGPDSTLRFARELEQILVGSYIDALTNVQTPAYRQTMAQILVNEARHQSALAGLQGKPPIGNALAKPVPMATMSDFLDKYES